MGSDLTQCILTILAQIFINLQNEQNNSKLITIYRNQEDLSFGSLKTMKINGRSQKRYPATWTKDFSLIVRWIRMTLGAFYSSGQAVFRFIVVTSRNRGFSQDGPWLRFVRIPIKKLVAPTSVQKVMRFNDARMSLESSRRISWTKLCPIIAKLAKVCHIHFWLGWQHDPGVLLSLFCFPGIRLMLLCWWCLLRLKWNGFAGRTMALSPPPVKRWSIKRIWAGMYFLTVNLLIILFDTQLWSPGFPFKLGVEVHPLSRKRSFLVTDLALP
jgi:hypothetical protein